MLKGFLYKTYDQELEQFFFTYNRPIVVVYSLVVMLTNGFWLLLDTVQYDMYSLHSPLPFATVCGMMFLSCFIAVYTILHKEPRSLLRIRFTLLFYMLSIAAEVVVLAMVKDLMVAGRGEIYDGIPISTLYLFFFIFTPFLHPVDCILQTAMIFLAILLPVFLPGGEAYALVPNLLLGACLPIGCLFYRRVMLNNAERTLELRRATGRYAGLARESLETIARAIDARDPYLRGHSHRVGAYARELGRRMGLSAEDQEELYFAGLLHDIGKIGTPDGILNKSGKLNSEEYDRIRAHTVDGYDILRGMGGMERIAQSVLSHHEHYNGTGYPYGKAGEDISLFARIICVADSYDAMSSDRAYRSAMSREAVYAELRRCTGTQFDPEVIAALFAGERDGEVFPTEKE